MVVDGLEVVKVYHQDCKWSVVTPGIGKEALSDFENGSPVEKPRESVGARQRLSRLDRLPELMGQAQTLDGIAVERKTHLRHKHDEHDQDECGRLSLSAAHQRLVRGQGCDSEDDEHDREPTKVLVAGSRTGTEERENQHEIVQRMGDAVACQVLEYQVEEQAQECQVDVKRAGPSPRGVVGDGPSEKPARADDGNQYIDRQETDQHEIGGSNRFVTPEPERKKNHRNV